MNDAYRDVRGVKVTTKRLRFALHRPFSPLYTDATNAGYQMFHAICAENKISCASAAGKSNIARYLLSNKNDRIFAIVDGAAFGADIKSVTHALTINTRSYIWTPESFEYLILQSGIFHEETLQKILNSPSEYIESGNFSSWERFFTRLLEELTKNTIYAYNKKHLNPNYLTRGNLEKLKQTLPVIVKFS